MGKDRPSQKSARDSAAESGTTITVRDLELHPVAFTRAASNAPEPLRDTMVDPPASTQRLEHEVEPLTIVRASRPSTSARPPRRAGDRISEAQKRGQADPLIGRIVADRYRIVSLLGRGGMGVVYKVEHIYIGKRMAMKLLSGEFARDALTVRRFQREAKAISKLLHTNTVQIFDFGQSAGLVYLVMEYLPGRDLGKLLADDGPLDFERTARIVAQVAASVSEAHQKGIIHRDLKPENVMVLDTSVDLVKVLDFGIAQLRDDSDDHHFDTASGTIVGTPFYMAPEQIRGGRVDAGVDIYALGGLMYKAMVGAPPFVADTPMGVLAMHLSDPVVPMNERAGRHDIPPEAEAIVARCLAKDRNDRYASMDELRRALLDYLGTSGAEAGPTEPLAELDVSTESLRSGEVLATRDDVDHYETSLRRSDLRTRLLSLTLIAVASYGTYELVEATRPREQVVEVEPNNDPAHANLLAPDRPLLAYLGKRSSFVYSDADVYRIDLGVNRARVADIAVSALPNMDLVVELARGGQKQPLLIVDEGGRAEPERIANFTLEGGTYFVRVRERWQSGTPPTENVSDAYTITLRYRGLGPDD